MKPENKIPVLDRISDEMKSVVNFHRDDLPPWPAADDFVAQRQHYIHERQLWNADAPEMNTRECVISTACGPVATRIYHRSLIARNVVLSARRRFYSR